MRLTPQLFKFHALVTFNQSCYCVQYCCNQVRSQPSFAGLGVIISYHHNSWIPPKPWGEWELNHMTRNRCFSIHSSEMAKLLKYAPEKLMSWSNAVGNGINPLIVSNIILEIIEEFMKWWMHKESTGDNSPSLLTFSASTSLLFDATSVINICCSQLSLVIKLQ